VSNLSFIIIAVVAVLILAGYLLRTYSIPSGARLPYKKRAPFLSAAERSFFGVLKGVAAGRYEVFAKVRIGDLLYVPGREEERQSYQNKIQAKHVDFLLCDQQALSPVVAIELDDASHRSARRRERDAFVNQAMNGAGLPLVRVPAQASYSPAELAARLDSAMTGAPAGAAPPAARSAAKSAVRSAAASRRR